MAFLVSLLVHALLYSAYKANRRYHWLDDVKLPVWLQPALRVVNRTNAPTQLTAPPELTVMPMAPPMSFVEVSNPSAEPPKDAKYYSSANAQAANPDASAASKDPKITGTDTRMVKTETVTKPAPQPLRPSVTPIQPTTKLTPQPNLLAITKVTPQTTPVPPTIKPEPAIPKVKATPEVLKTEAALPTGDLTLARPADTPIPAEAPARPARPRTVKEAYARLALQNPEAYAGLVGPKMKQEGGVKNRNLVTSLDTKATAYGAYDAALIYAVQNRWYALLDAKGFAGESIGKVNLQFRLHYDGRVSDMQVLSATVDDLLSIICQRAILDNSPYDRWPTAMRNEIGADFRDVTFTFFYLAP
jgi:hypothetical protein